MVLQNYFILLLLISISSHAAEIPQRRAMIKAAECCNIDELDRLISPETVNTQLDERGTALEICINGVYGEPAITIETFNKALSVLWEKGARFNKRWESSNNPMPALLTAARFATCSGYLDPIHFLLSKTDPFSPIRSDQMGTLSTFDLHLQSIEDPSSKLCYSERVNGYRVLQLMAKTTTSLHVATLCCDKKRMEELAQTNEESVKSLDPIFKMPPLHFLTFYASRWADKQEIIDALALLKDHGVSLSTLLPAPNNTHDTFVTLASRIACVTYNPTILDAYLKVGGNTLKGKLNQAFEEASWLIQKYGSAMLVCRLLKSCDPDATIEGNVNKPLLDQKATLIAQLFAVKH